MEFKIMKPLIRYKLEYDCVWDFLQNNLDQTNTLSSELLNLADFSKGSFFTLLPNNLDRKNINEFECGICKKTALLSITNCIRKGVCELIYKKINSESKSSCLFDDVLRSPTDKYCPDLFFSHGLSYENEMYYLLEKSPISEELILACLRLSNACWHSLCILTDNFSNRLKEKKITLNEIKKMCSNTSLVIIGAYDGQGYIFWEKNF
ncbi:MAG: hypothetical protein S4CHLAM45_05250 [Chlamydiales bacterium]|nr:hypothetical protein [Chlamydiales bacterium]MCH9619934.1 hypothetical protein [Chlamydiales bacterium]MCH9622639.1 hypothetical protein [Chlamydiales bacterium]